MTSKDTKPTTTGVDAPVDLAPTDLARIYTHIHPIAVLSLYYARFAPTVADPVASLTQLAAPVALLQILYSIICIPLSTPPKSPKTSGPTPQPARKQKTTARDSRGVLSKVFPAILSLTLALALGTPLLFIIIVLHGGPITTHVPHTALTALHMSLLATLPLFFAHGVDSQKWRHIAGLMAPVDELLGAALGACVGAWAGAVPIPLDWDREWQKWPVTVVYGIVLGWAAGKLIGGTVGFGRRISVEK